MRPIEKVTNLRILILTISALIVIYSICYLISAKRIEYYSGSSPIHDPTWSVTAEIYPHYRFLPPAFWYPAHRVDRVVRPNYWTFEVSAILSEDIQPVPMNTPLFSTR